ncbi:hypothetical protein CP965_08260 [Halarcobacter mediterraneus]|uniref:Lipoprotein n=1 Tax=Halarcobacter mediterraneus TaxID=2023153 RepID=A0A4Q1ASA1_9BACT|nr:hypothetical protein [Halarcobacter mediterraneus]RXK12563.1 hypothetical protein CP965_08260 [Halarcobacter mediterraneus]
MKKTVLVTGILLVFILILSGCKTAAIHNIDNTDYINDKKVNTKKVENAIVKAAMKRGWGTKKIKTGLIEAKNNVRGKHLVIVNINYNSKGYKISYKDSRNMKYDAGSNTIHKNYNKWIGNLEKDINYELFQIGDVGPTSREVLNIKPKKKEENENYSKSNSSEINGKIIYLKRMTPFSTNSRVATNIKTECTINEQLASFIKQYALEQGLKVEYKDNPSSKDLFLDVKITEAVSQGGAFRGHSKFVIIEGKLVKGNKKYGSFKAARVSGGGFWGAYKSSCSVLGRTVKALGNDVSIWLYSPIDNARLGDTDLLR